MYQRILVATDGSPLSDKAVTTALHLAKMSQAQVIALKVIPRYPTSYFEGGAALDAHEIGRIEKQWQNEAQAVVQAVQAQGQQQGISITPVALAADVVSDTILNTAKKHQCDLIVMASHGRKGIERLLMGSETQQVLTHSTLPVLVIK